MAAATVRSRQWAAERVVLEAKVDQVAKVLSMPESPELWNPDKAAKLFARVKFQYSKVLPLRTKIYELQDTERTLRAKKTALRLSKSKD